jgi:hypothetical protein
MNRDRDALSIGRPRRLESVRGTLSAMARPRAALAVLCIAILACAAMHSGHGVESTDNRTYVQMIAGVARSGLPCWDNGPIDRFGELVVPWAVPSGGRLCGNYGPLYPYLAAPAFLLGSLRAVSAFTFALLAPIAVLAFHLARCFVRSEWYAVMAACLAVVSTPLLAKSVEMTAYPLAALASLAGTYLAVRIVLDENDRIVWPALACGVAWGAAVASHVLCFPMAIVTITAVAVAVRSRRGRLGAMLAALGLAAAMAPLALLNRLRFGSYNPLSYGPIPWRHYEEHPIVHMTVSDQLRWAAPCIAWGAALLVALFVVRRSRARAVAVVIAGIVVLLLSETLRVRASGYAMVLFGYVVDMTALPLDFPFHRAADGIGQVHNGWVVRSTLQCAPLLALAPLLPWQMRRRGGERVRAAWVLLAPAFSLYAAMGLRANMGLVDAFGVPWLFLRYTIPALPILVVASVVVLEKARPGRVEAASAMVSAVVLGACFIQLPEDDRLKRLLLVVVPLLAAVGAVVAVLSRRRPPKLRARLLACLLGLAIGVGVACGLGHDLRAAVLIKGGVDAWVDALTRVVPRRFAIFGLGGFPDDLFTTTVTHDARYAVVFRPEELPEIRPLLDVWRAEQRPIFMVWENPPPSPWADVTFDHAEGVNHVYAVRFASR